MHERIFSTASARLFEPTVPFTTAQARTAGITRHQLASKRYRKLFYSVYVDSSVEVTPRLRACAALSVSAPGSYASHFTAAKIWGTWLDDDADTHICVPADQPRSKRRGIRAHVANPHAEVTVHQGVPIASPAQTFLDLAPYVDLVELVVLGDSLVKRGLVTPEDLVLAADRWVGRGRRRARRAARLVRRGVDSPMETRLRMLIVLAGLPEPVVNHILVNDDGSWKLRFDLSYPQWTIAIEYDGRQHADSTTQWTRDIIRREATDRLGWRIIVVLSEGIFRGPDETLARIVQALRDRGVTGVCIRGDEWRRHFPGHAR